MPGVIGCDDDVPRTGQPSDHVLVPAGVFAQAVHQRDDAHRLGIGAVDVVHDGPAAPPDQGAHDGAHASVSSGITAPPAMSGLDSFSHSSG